jgi:hypothetical protein
MQIDLGDKIGRSEFQENGWQNVQSSSPSLYQSLLTGCIGLLGVLVGSFATAIAHRKERRNALLKEKLRDFYGPMLGMKSVIGARNNVGIKVAEAARGFWLDASAMQTDADGKKEIEGALISQQEVLDQYGEVQIKRNIVPDFRRMLDWFTDHLWLAEPSTMTYYPILFEYVETWNRVEANVLPFPITERLNHSEDRLEPFYEDLQMQFERLNSELQR